MNIAMLGLRSIGHGSGGIERAVEEVSVRLVTQGHDVTVFCRGRYNPDHLEEFEGVKLRNLPSIYTKHLEAISHTLLGVFVAWRSFDVLHIHAIGPSLWAWFPRLLGNRVVVTVHGLDWRREKWGGLATAILKCGAWASARFPHETIVVSQGLKIYYQKRYGKKVTYIPNGVPETIRRPLQALKRFGVETGQYVLFLGRLVPEKGAHALMDALAQLEFPRKLLIVGDATHTDDYVAELKKKAAGKEHIIFTGPLYGEEKDEAYSNAACVVMPSTIEGFPIVMLEAMGYGTPVLCSDIPENMEIASAVQPPLAMSYKNGSTMDLAEKISYGFDHLDLMKEMAERAKQYVREQFSWDEIANRTSRIYKQEGSS